MPESPYEMLPVDQALRIVLEHAQRLPPVDLPLLQAAGSILAGDIVAQEPLPPFPASIKDGYAVVAADGPGEYPIIGASTAGRVPEVRVLPGTVAYITTGAPLPQGADAVVMVEQTKAVLTTGRHNHIRITTRVREGQDIRSIGADIDVGMLVLSKGELLGAAEIGLLATVGVTTVPVFARPKVGILSTGDELIEPAEALGPGQIRDSNRYMLAAAVKSMGGIPVDLGIAADSQSGLESAVQRGLDQVDILLTSGGVSMGDLDLIKPLLEHAGIVHFGRIRMKPGKPLTFATADVDGAHRLIFGLPGNPVSSIVTFYLMAAPAIRKLAGRQEPNLPRVQAVLDRSLALDPERPEYHRATLRWDVTLNNGNGGLLATSTGSQASSRLLSVRTANALLELPQADGELAAGSVVTALVIGVID